MNSNFNKLLLLLLIASVVFIGLKTVLPNKLFKNTISTKNTNIVKDSLMLKAIADQEKNINKDILPAIIQDTITKKVIAKNPDINLPHFYNKLAALETDKKTKIRIAYFGDSMNDGDLVVQDLRAVFQEKYGGKGVGFVNIYSESAKGRGSVLHDFSNNWNHSSFLKKQANTRLGISGYVAFANDTLNGDVWVKYNASYKRPLSRPTLFYGKTDSLGASILIDKKEAPSQKMELKGKKILNKLRLPNTSSQKLKITFKTNNTPIYGVNFDNKEGIYIDNFSCRGNSGLALSLLNNSLTRQFQKELKYDLIVLQFGTNVVSKKNVSYNWYSKGMLRVIKNLQKSFPDTDILLMSVADKSRKYNTEMKTDSALYGLLKTQKKTALESNISFMNIYKLMGGENSMVKWVEEKPIMAQKDYTHFNPKGSKKMATLIFDALEKNYKKYKEIMLKDSISANNKTPLTKLD